MDMRSEKQGDILVLFLKGEFDAMESEVFADAITKAVEGGERRVILDFGGPEFVDSSAIKCLLQAQRDLQDAGGGLSVVGPRLMVAKVLERLQIQHVLPIHETHAEARVALES